jgi:hypothetical protein
MSDANVLHVLFFAIVAMFAMMNEPAVVEIVVCFLRKAAAAIGSMIAKFR